MADIAAGGEGKKSKGLKWYWVALIAAVGTGLLWYMWMPKCIHSAADVMYDPVTGEKYASGTVKVNPQTGQKF